MRLRSIKVMFVLVFCLLVGPLHSQHDEDQSNELRERLIDRVIDSNFSRDKNEDGKLSFEEWAWSQWSEYRRLDENKDQVLTKSELRKHFENRARAASKRPKVTLDDPGKQPIVRLLDEDSDGALSAIEIEQAGQTLLKMDKNKDGELSRVELLTATALLFKKELRTPDPLPGFLGDRTKQRLALNELQELESACVVYKLAHQKFPAKLKSLFEVPDGMGKRQWKGPYAEGRLRADPWGKPYRYSANEKTNSVEIYSCGPDGEAGTRDDISNQPPEKF